MKILELDLRAFGPFTGRKLDLSGGSQGLHFLFGPNEAGKSSALKAIRQLLYGIDHQTDQDFIHKHKELRIGATLDGPGGDRLAFVRLKKIKDPLWEPDESAPIDPDALRRFLDGVDRERFETLFGLDHDRLVAGGKAILANQGELGELIFGAGAELPELSRLRKKLDKDAGDLFKPRGENQPLSRALIELEMSKRRIEEASIKGTDWVETRAAHDRAKIKRSELADRIERLDADRSRLQRLAQARPDAARRREILGAIAALPPPPKLPAACAARRQAAEDDRADAEKEAKLAEAEVEALSALLEAIEAPGAILESADAIDEIARRADLSHAQTPKAEAAASRRDALGRQIADALADLGRDAENLGSVRSPSLPKRARIQRLSEQYGKIQLDQKEARGAANTARAALDQIDATLADGKTVLDSLNAVGPAIRKALDRLKTEGNPAAAAKTSRAERDRLETRRLRAFADLFGPDADPKPNRIVPAAEVVEELAAELDEAGRVVKEAKKALDTAERVAVEIAAKIERIREGGEIPTPADLKSARNSRDLLWRLVRADWRSEPSSEEDRRALVDLDATDLALKFERLQKRADDLADLLRSETERLTLLMQLRQEGAVAEDDRDRARRVFAEAEMAREEAKARWRTTWERLGVAVGTPKAMRSWMNQHADLLRFEADSDGARLRCETDDDRVEEFRGLFLKALGPEAAGLGDAPLSDLIERASEVLDRFDKAANRSEDYADRRAVVAKELETAEDDKADADRRLDEWSLDWGRTLAPLGLEPDSEPSEANRVLERAEELAKFRREFDAAVIVVDDYRDSRGRLIADLRALAIAVAPDLTDPEAPDEFDPDRDPGPMAQELKRRLAAASKAETRITTQEEARDGAIGRVEAARRRASEAHDRLNALAAEAGLDDPGEIEAMETLEAGHVALRDELGQVESRLRVAAKGDDLDAFGTQAVAADPDESEAAARRHEVELRTFQSERSHFDEEVGRLGRDLDAMDEKAREANALEAALVAESQGAKARADASKYVRLRLASAVLRETIRSYQEEHQAPTLERASGLFAGLTAGSFAGLRAELDDQGRQVLVGVRPGGEALAVEAMSEGTRDQLYLALKLAALDRHLDSRPALPLVLDDVLVNFDDDRATAALLVLAEFSKRAQILFFTHHRHLLELAEKVLPPSVVFPHELARR